MLLHRHGRTRDALVTSTGRLFVGTDERPFAIAPNPAQNSVRLQFPVSMRRAVRIVDAQGRLAEGISMASITDATGTHTTSFIVTP